MFEMHSEWGPAHDDDHEAYPREAMWAALDLRDDDGARPDDN